MPLAATQSRDIELLPTLIVLFVCLCAAYFLTARRMIATLKADYYELWTSLGRPEAIDSLMSRRFDFFTESIRSGPRFNSWIYKGGYRELANASLTVLAKRLLLLRLLGAVTLAFGVGCYAIRRHR
jgi:hypothetical protein